MTYQSPRIYTYKITFEEVPYYYYGVHKEKYFNEEYWGSPKTNKWCWEFYTPKKQILEVFEFSDGEWLEAQEVEKRLIQPVFNTDKWCLNESCGGRISLSGSRKGGKRGGEINAKNKTGVCGLTTKQRKENGKKGMATQKKLCIGIFSLSKEQLSSNGKRGGNKGGNKSKELGVGIFAMTKEQNSKSSRKGGKIGGKLSCSQKWKCIETGFISNPGNLTKYQRARGIDTSKRIRIFEDTL
jgi:hypothetical protein